MYPIEVTIVGPPPGRSVWGERYIKEHGTVGGGLTRQGIRGVGLTMVIKRYIHVGTCSDRM